MDTKLVTANVRMSQWKAIIEDRNQTNLSVKEYCELNNLSKNAYYYWLRKIKEATISQNPEIFAELVMLTAKDVTATEIGFFNAELRICVGDAVIELNANTSKKILEMAVEVLSNAK